MENNFSQNLICRDEVKSTHGTLELGIRLPWYRALPLSVIELGEIVIDDQSIPFQNVGFEINGKEYSLGQLADLTSEFWYVLDSAHLRVPYHLDPKRPHTISVTINLYPPYIPGLAWVTRGFLALEANT